MIPTNNTFFAPQLFIPHGMRDLSFYQNALGAIELRRWNNDDGSVHVAELSINNVLFHIHEERETAGRFSPQSANGTTALIGLFVLSVDDLVDRAVKAGAILKSSPKTYDYDYRQAEIEDPFGHLWLIQQKV